MKASNEGNCKVLKTGSAKEYMRAHLTCKLTSAEPTTQAKKYYYDVGDSEWQEDSKSTAVKT